jgi:hypothetical protein
MFLRSFIPFAHGLMQRIHVLWKQERTAVAQTEAAGQTKEPDLPGACMEIAIATLTFSLRAHNLKVIGSNPIPATKTIFVPPVSS